MYVGQDMCVGQYTNMVGQGTCVGQGKLQRQDENAT